MAIHDREHPKILSVRAAAVFVFLLMAFSATASADDTRDLVRISGASPFDPECGSNPGTQPTVVVNYVDSEAEPYVAVNPVHPDNIVAMWQQDLWSNGATKGHVLGVSFDRGVTWQLVPVPGLGDCTEGSFDRVVDPWLSFDSGGRLYQISLVFNIDPPPNRTGGLGLNALLVSYSDDGGLSWSEPPATLIEDPNGVLNDKPSITADPTDPNYVYAAWQRFQSAKGPVVAPPNPGISYPFGLGFRGPFYFARSTDAGQSWEPAHKIYSPGANNVTSGHQIVVMPDPDGTLFAFFGEALGFRNDDGDMQFDFNLALLRSPDKGKRWFPRGRPQRIANMLSFGNFTPDEGRPVFGGIFDVAVDRLSGDLYAVWQDVRFTGVEAIAFSMSIDGGFTWSAPIMVNQTPSDISLPRQQAFVPSVAVNHDGVIAVTYYDFRNDDDMGELADHFGVYCSDNCTDVSYWSNEVQLTNVSFDILSAPFAKGTTTGFFVGDYDGLASDGTDFLSVFAQPHDNDPDSIFFRRFGP